jgi:hypothetical protein
VTSWELAEDEARHSIVRSPDRRARSDRNTERSKEDVVMSGVRNPQSADVEVVLGVDTHLDFHVAVALDNLGRRLGELAVPTTTKGYKRLLFAGLKTSELLGALGSRAPAATVPGWLAT